MSRGHDESASKRRQTVACSAQSGELFTVASSQSDLRLFKTALDASNDALAICACAADAPVIIYANPAFCSLTGFELVELYGRPYDFMLPADLPQCDRMLLSQALIANQSATTTVRCAHRNGKEIWSALRVSALRDGSGRTTHYLIALREVDETQECIEQLRFLAQHDPLTGLPNRRLLFDRLDCALARYERYGENFAVAFVDVDRFKRFNDVLGHAIGDALLKHVARCLSLSVRASDTVGRLGGDEFLLLLTGTAEMSDIDDTLARALEFIDEPVTFAGQSIKLTCSIGVAACPLDGTSIPALLQKADAAMYRLKTRAAAREPT